MILWYVHAKYIFFFACKIYHGGVLRILLEGVGAKDDRWISMQPFVFSGRITMQVSAKILYFVFVNIVCCVYTLLLQIENDFHYL